MVSMHGKGRGIGRRRDIIKVIVDPRAKLRGSGGVVERDTRHHDFTCTRLFLLIFVEKEYSYFYSEAIPAYRPYCKNRHFF